MDFRRFMEAIKNMNVNAKKYYVKSACQRAIDSKSYNKFGVIKHGNKWRARIRIQNVSYHIGIYDTMENAKLARIFADKNKDRLLLDCEFMNYNEEIEYIRKKCMDYVETLKNSI